jgi:hypothetical protein
VAPRTPPVPGEGADMSLGGTREPAIAVDPNDGGPDRLQRPLVPRWELAAAARPGCWATENDLA